MILTILFHMDAQQQLLFTSDVSLIFEIQKVDEISYDYHHAQFRQKKIVMKMAHDKSVCTFSRKLTALVSVAENRDEEHLSVLP